MSTIYLLRHGETVWNTLGRFQGQKDSPLTTLGIEQADFVANVLYHELSVDGQSFEMQVSPLGRTRETASRIRRSLSLPSVEDARLMEVTVGSWDGMTRFEIDSEFPGYLDGSDAFDWYFKSPDGESFDDACNRAKAWIADIGRPTIAISHGLFGRIIRGVYTGLSKREMLELPVPQDGFYRLHDGAFCLIDGLSRAPTQAPCPTPAPSA
ncbi:histidine phosphatase family protein [Agrobacterium tumefaciens]|uniref:histidine phosphatase family protein n=1 Tax=Agrobacterium tumefaciens TaxID=358 RepID=UPI001572B8E3|nr:histidine phosphatase family protein [Agrobacterium tumefaciens]WCK01074.1 phosphoglycerate mutase family protein [Agrobacterium tumefaciens]